MADRSLKREDQELCFNLHDFELMASHPQGDEREEGEILVQIDMGRSGIEVYLWIIRIETGKWISVYE